MIIPDTFSRILISRLRFMGDVILTTPLLRQLRARYPEAKITYLTEDRFVPLLHNNPHIDEVMGIKLQRAYGESRRRMALEQAKFLYNLRRKKFDLAIDLFGNPRTALLSLLSGAGVRIGGDFRGRGLLYNLRVPLPDQRFDAITFHQRSLEQLGITPADKKTELFLLPVERDLARTYLQRKGLDPDAPIIGLHPGATWPNKRWPAENFSRLASELVDRGVQVYVTCGPGEQDIATTVAGGRIGPVVSGDVLPLRTLAAVISHFKAMVSNDCGVLHMSVAVETPTAGIFGPGEPDIWFPYSEAEGHKAFFADIDCRPCHKDFCPLNTLECMHKTTPEAVLAWLEQRMKTA